LNLHENFNTDVYVGQGSPRKMLEVIWTPTPVTDSTSGVRNLDMDAGSGLIHLCGGLCSPSSLVTLYSWFHRSHSL